MTDRKEPSRESAQDRARGRTPERVDAAATAGDLIERRLKQLGAATEAIVPSERFHQRIIDAAEQRSATRWLDVPWRVGGVALVVGALAAAASVLLALRVQTELDDQMLVSADWVEMDP